MTSDADRGSTESPTADVTILPDGSFTFNNVPPGSYQIRGRAHTVAGGASLFALYRVVLVDHDVTVRLVLLPGARVSGRVSADAERTAKPATLAGLRIQAPFADGQLWLRATSTPSRMVVHHPAHVGSHIKPSRSCPNPWVLGVTYRGRDIPTWANGRRAALDGVHVRSPRRERVSGRSGPGGTLCCARTSGGFPIRLIPTTLSLGSAERPRTRRPLSLTGLPPCEYRVVLRRLTKRRLSPRSPQQLFDAGVPLRLDALATRVIDLRLTPIATLRRTSAR